MKWYDVVLEATLNVRVEADDETDAMVCADLLMVYEPANWVPVEANEVTK